MLRPAWLVETRRYVTWQHRTFRQALALFAAFRLSLAKAAECRWRRVLKVAESCDATAATGKDSVVAAPRQEDTVALAPSIPPRKDSVVDENMMW